MRRAGFIALLLVACDPFGRWPENNEYWLDVPMWDEHVVAAIDGIYVNLPRTGQLVRVVEDGSFGQVDLDGLVPDSIVPDPDSERIVVFGKWPECADDDPEIETISDCPEEELTWNAELAVVAAGKRGYASAVPSHMNDVSFSPDGLIAVAFHNEDEGSIEQTQGIVDLTEVVFVPMDSGTATSVSIGFNPNNILFTEDSTRAVVMSRSKVVVVDLETFSASTDYPLTLDADQTVDPADAVLTPDGDYALVAIEGESELYVLDLENPSITIETLDSAPADLAVYRDPADDTDPGVTLVAYASRAQLDILANDNSFNLEESIELDDPATGILTGDGFALLYNDRSDSVHDVYRYDFATTELTEYVVDNPVDHMQLTDSGAYAVGVLRPESGGGSGIDQYQNANWGLAVVDLATDDAVSLVVEAEPVGLALVEDEDGSFALVLMDGVDELFQVDLSRPSQAVAIALPDYPTGIGSMPDGRFYITHDAALGLISFLDPATGEITTTGGFATPELLVDETLPRRGEEEE